MLQNGTILEVKSNFRQQWFEWQIMLTSWLNSHTADLLTASGWSITVLLSFCLHVFLCPSLYHPYLFCWLFLVSYSLHYVLSLLSLSFSLSVSFCVSGQISLQSVATPLFILIAIWGQWLFKASRSKPSVFLISLSLSHSFPLSCSFLCTFILVSLSIIDPWGWRAFWPGNVWLMGLQVIFIWVQVSRAERKCGLTELKWSGRWSDFIHFTIGGKLK